MFTLLSKSSLSKMSNIEVEKLEEVRDEDKGSVQNLRSHEHGISDASELMEQNFLSSMSEIRRTDNTEAETDLEEVLRERAKIYGKHLDPSWFSHGSDLGGKLKGRNERNLARSMLVGAPLMVAQKGAQTLRKKMIEGDSQILQNLQMDTPTTLGQVLDKLKAAPPLRILNLCNKETGAFVTKNLLQHSEDLDYVQDVLNVVGSHSELTPTLHAVLAGFNRRRTSGSFKQGHKSIVMDRLRFSHLASPNDNDGGIRSSMKKRVRTTVSRVCRYYQQTQGCDNRKGCRFEHKCSICGSQSHGAIYCREGGKRNSSSKLKRKSYSH